MKSLTIIQIPLFLMALSITRNASSQVINRGNDKPLTITITARDFDNTFLLSKHVKSIRLIPLETKPECLIGQIIQMEFVGNEILILQKKSQNGILVFDQNGKFLRSIGRKGKGPGEYGGIKNFSVEPGNRRIYLTDPYQQNISIFDLSGKFIRNIHQDGMFGGPAYVLNSNRIVVKDHITSKASLVIWDSLGHEIKSFFPSDQKKHGWIPGEFAPLGDELTVFRYAVDSVFSISNDLIHTEMIVNLGDHHLAQDEFDASFPGTPDNKWILFGNLLTNNQIICFSILKQRPGQEYYSTVPTFYWPASGKIEVIDEKKSDDLFLTEYLNFTNVTANGDWATSYQAINLAENRNKILANKTPLLTGKTREITGRLNDNDNPVIVVYGLK